MIQYFSKTRSQRREEEGESRPGLRTDYLLASVVIVFVVSRLPLNLFNVFIDLGLDSAIFGSDFSGSSAGLTVFACCHMIGTLSAIANPLLYGYFNQEFRKAFVASCSFC